jgi:hypothetical protein
MSTGAGVVHFSIPQRGAKPDRHMGDGRTISRVVREVQGFERKWRMNHEIVQCSVAVLFRYRDFQSCILLKPLGALFIQHLVSTDQAKLKMKGPSVSPQ